MTDYILVSNTGTYAETGNTANVLHGYLIIAAKGTYLETGRDGMSAEGRLYVTDKPGKPTGGQFYFKDRVKDSNGILWTCRVPGFLGKWQANTNEIIVHPDARGYTSDKVGPIKDGFYRVGDFVNQAADGGQVEDWVCVEAGFPGVFVLTNVGGPGALAFTKDTPGAPTGGHYIISDTVTDSLGNDWVCTEAGYPGEWELLAI